MPVKAGGICFRSAARVGCSRWSATITLDEWLSAVGNHGDRTRLTGHLAFFPPLFRRPAAAILRTLADGKGIMGFGHRARRLLARVLALAVLMFALAPMPMAGAVSRVPISVAGGPCQDHGAEAPEKPAGMACCLGDLCAMVCTALPVPRPTLLADRQPAILAFAATSPAAPDAAGGWRLYRPPRDRL